MVEPDELKPLHYLLKVLPKEEWRDLDDLLKRIEMNKKDTDITMFLEMLSNRMKQRYDVSSLYQRFKRAIQTYVFLVTTLPMAMFGYSASNVFAEPPTELPKKAEIRECIASEDNLVTQILKIKDLYNGEGKLIRNYLTQYKNEYGIYTPDLSVSCSFESRIKEMLPFETGFIMMFEKSKRTR